MSLLKIIETYGLYAKINRSLKKEKLETMKYSLIKEKVNFILTKLESEYSDFTFDSRLFLHDYFFNLMLNANLYKYKKQIRLNPEWMFLLIIKSNDPSVRSAFQLSLGHEMTHMNDYPLIGGINPINRKFVHWVNEVYCDYGSAKRMAYNSKKTLLEAIKFKREYKLKQIGRDEDYASHPSWERRYSYVDVSEQFDESLIRQIAKDTGCKNERLIQDVCDFYKGKEIQLI